MNRRQREGLAPLQQRPRDCGTAASSICREEMGGKQSLCPHSGAQTSRLKGLRPHPHHPRVPGPSQGRAESTWRSEHPGMSFYKQPSREDPVQHSVILLVC